MIEVFRKEIKYSISTVSFYKVRPLFDACMQMDPYCTSGAGYQVRSLYFDSACDGDLFDVLDGLLSKQKVRLRCYSPESETMKLEYKCKTGTDSQKKSLTVSRQDAKRMMAGCYEFLRDIPDPVSTELYGRLKAGVYRPRVVVMYRRIAYNAAPNDVRITFDYDLQFGMDPYALIDPTNRLVPISEPASGILEVKYNGFLPGYLKTALEGVNLFPVANSKYAQARLFI